MADPWTDDLAALGEHTRRGLRSLDATRAALEQRQETPKMRFFKNHPGLAALIALAVIALAAPIAYAVVHGVWLSVDPAKPPAEIEKDVQGQLQAAGVNGTVHAEKADDGQLRVEIHSDDPSLGSDFHVSVAGQPAAASQRMLRFEVGYDCTPDQMTQLTALVSGSDMIAVLAKDYPSNDELVAAVKNVFETHGFHDVDVAVTDTGIVATVKAPPT